MNKLKPIAPCFSIPVGSFNIPNQDELNKGLRKLILNSEKDNHKNKNPSQKIQPEVFESDFNFFDWDNQYCTAIKNLMLMGVRKVISEVTSLTENEIARLAPSYSSWFHITRRGGYVQPHNHPNASWSAVYCVTEGIKDEEHQDSGALIFHPPAGFGSMYQDPANSNLVGPYSHYSKKYVLKSSDLIIFPSELIHSVSPYFGDGERITIAANVWFKWKTAG